MKRNIAVIAAIMMGIYCLSGMTVRATQNEVQKDSQEENGGIQAADENRIDGVEQQTEAGNLEEGLGSQTVSGNQQGNPGSLATDADSTDKAVSDSELCSLQIPQRLGIVIDPWEIGGQGQIYSEKYVISNTGDKEGVLTLSFLCKAPEGSDAEIRVDSQGLHDGEDKAIYLEMVFEDGTRIPLLQDGMEYETVLGAGEELTVSFSGEVNENASQAWKDGDVEVEGVYSWSITEDIQKDAPLEPKPFAGEDGREDASVEENDARDESTTENPKESATPDVSRAGDSIQDTQGTMDDSVGKETRADGAEATQERDIGQPEKDDPIEQEE